MLLLFLFVVLLFASLRKILFWTGLWQNKEYRLDRLLVHLRETNQGKKLFASSSTIGGTLIILSYIFVILFDWFAPFFQVFVLGFFLFSVFDFGKQILDRKLKRPIFTYKTALIILLSLVSTSVLFFFPLTDKYLWTLILLGITPFVVSVWVFLLSFPSEIYTDYLMQKAQKKIKQCKQLTVIAVSGSYGKSSTKEAIATILSQKFSVVKTPLSNNTPIGIAKTILKQIDETTQFFVVEMGAYKIGEIAQLCTMVKPHISVTTSVSDQHLSLYGNFENVIASESELIHALAKNGIAIFNANNKNTTFLSTKTKQKKIFTKVADAPMLSRKNFIVAYDVTLKTDSILFSVSFAQQTMHLKTNLIGQHVLENILPAIYLGIHFGLNDKEIQKGVNIIHPLPHTLQKVDLPRGVIGVDDTFNASPESVISAANYLNLFSTKKFFILTPLIELGKHAAKRHREIGQVLADVDYLLVTNKNYYKDIETGIRSKDGKAVLIYGTYEELTDILKRFPQKGDCIVFEGKEAGVVLKKVYE